MRTTCMMPNSTWSDDLMQADTPGEVSADQDLDDLVLLRDQGLDLLAKVRQVRDPGRRQQILDALFEFLDDQIRSTQH